MKAIEEEVRVRIVRAVVEKGKARGEVAEIFGVSVPSVGRYVRAHQAGESLVPRVSTGRPRKLRLAEHVAALREHLQAEPDMELAERGEHLQESEGIFLSVPTLWRASRALGFTRKKRL